MADAERQRLNNQCNALSRWVADLEQRLARGSQNDPALRARLVETKSRLQLVDLARKAYEARRARELANQLEAEVQDALMAAAVGGVR